MIMGKKKKDDLEEYKDITVANMNVEGMPWYTKKPEDIESSGASSGRKEILTPKETGKLIANALVAALLIGGVFFYFVFIYGSKCSIDRKLDFWFSLIAFLSW